MPRTGRPPREISWDALDAMLTCAATLEEVCAYFDVSKSTIRRAVKAEYGVNYDTLSREKRKAGRLALRRKQMELALKGNATMLVWLGKQYLGQTDRAEIGPLEAKATFRTLAMPGNGEVPGGNGRPDALPSPSDGDDQD